MPKNTSAELVKKIAALPECPPALLLLAPDNIRKDRITNLLLDTFLRKQSKGSNEQLAIKRIDARELTKDKMRAFRDDLASLSLFTPLRFFIFSDIDELSTDLLPTFQEIIRTLSKDSKLIICGSALPEKHALKKLFKEKDLLVELEELRGHELTRWVARELKRSGINRYSEGVVDTLVLCGEEAPDKIARLLEQLVVYCDSDSINSEDLSRLFVHHITPGEFELLDAIQAKKIAKVEVMLREILASGKSPFMLLALISRSYSNYLLLKALSDAGLSQQELRQRLGMTPWVFNKYVAASKNRSLGSLKNNMRQIMRTDSILKNRSLGPEAVLSELVSGLMA